MSAVKEELKKVVGELSEDQSKILLNFAEWLKDRNEEFTEKEFAMLKLGEEQTRKGDVVAWRDVKRTKV